MKDAFQNGPTLNEAVRPLFTLGIGFFVQQNLLVILELQDFFFDTLDFAIVF